MTSATRASALVLFVCGTLLAGAATAQELGPASLVATPTPAASPGGDPLALEDQPDPLFDEEWGEEAGDGPPQVYDPFEETNRAVLVFNQAVDQVLWEPLTRGYRLAVPDPARRCVRRAFFNFNAPVYLANHLLQGDPLAAAEVLGAFVLNSTFGIGGLFDAGSAAGFHMEAADFGQTMAKVGVGAGPYLVFPFFGPSTLRDGFGGLVDRAMHPLTYVIGIVPSQLIYDGGAGLTRREAVADELRALEESSLDFYAVLRSAYVQARARELRPESDGGFDPDPGSDRVSAAETP